MNAIPPGGLVPEEPLTRSSAARRGAKTAAGADKVSLMVALEDEVEDGARGARGAVMLEDADEAHSEPQPHRPGAVGAEAQNKGKDQDPAIHDPMIDSQEATAAYSSDATGPTSLPAAGPESETNSPAGEAIPQKGPAATLGIEPSAEQVFERQPDAGADRAARPEPVPATGRQAPFPDDASISPGHAPAPHEMQAEPHRTHRSPAAESWHEPVQSEAAARTQRPGSHRPDQERPGPWASSRQNSHDHATADAWDRPPPPPRPSSRGPTLPAASLGMPVQLSGIEVTLSVEIGSHRLSLRDLLSVEPGQLVPLDRMTSEPVDILVNGKPFARGEVVAIGDRFGVRLTELVDGSDAG